MDGFGLTGRALWTVIMIVLFTPIWIAFFCWFVIVVITFALVSRCILWTKMLWRLPEPLSG